MILMLLLSLLLSYSLEAAGPKAPPPVLVNEVPTMMGFASAVTYFTPDGRYIIKIDRNANTVAVYDISDPTKKPELISTNQYQAEIKEEKKE